MLTPDRLLRVALLSCAHTHAASYAARLDARDDVDLVVSDPDGFGDVPARRLVASHAEAWEAWPATADERGGPDAVIVTSENALHAELVLEAARRGVPVLCEKPLATTVADAEAMVAACREAGVLLMTAYPVHFSSQIGSLREAVTGGALGEVVGLTGTNNGKLPRGRDWFTDVALSGGGAMVDHVVHLAQVLDGLFGEPATVSAAANRILSADRAGDGAETGALVTLTYDGGPVATIDCSWSQPDDAPTWGGLTLQAVGTGGQLEVDAFSRHVGGVGRWLPYGEDLDAALLDTFLTAVRDGRSTGVEPSGEVGLRTVRVVAAAQRSLTTGSPEPLP